MASESGEAGPQNQDDELESHPPAAYTVGWISALPTEFKAAQVMLDNGTTLPKQGMSMTVIPTS